MKLPIVRRKLNLNKLYGQLGPGNPLYAGVKQPKEMVTTCCLGRKNIKKVYKPTNVCYGNSSPESTDNSLGYIADIEYKYMYQNEMELLQSVDTGLPDKEKYFLDMVILPIMKPYIGRIDTVEENKPKGIKGVTVVEKKRQSKDSKANK